LRWDAASDNVAVTGYRVYRDGTLRGSSSATTFTSAGLAPNTTYSFTVVAYDAAGNTSSHSNALSVTTASNSSSAYTTPFDLNENPISEGGRWHRANNQWTNVQTVGGAAFATNGVTNMYDDSYALLSGFQANQTLEAVVFRDPSLSPGPTHEVELLLRATDGPGFLRGYDVVFDYLGTFQIVKWNGEFGNVSWVHINEARNLGRQLVSGDVLKATISGSTIRVYINGQEMGWASDSSITTGQPGIGFFIRPGGSQRFIGYTSVTVTSP
jgi:hypothetical protein